MEQRYFIAIVPPAEIGADIMAIKSEVAEQYNSKGALRSPAHITLHMPFLWEETKEQKLIDSLNGVKHKTIPNIELNGFDHFGDRVIFINVVPNEELQNFQAALVRHVKVNLRLFNQDEDRRGFHPHVTVAFRDLRKQQFAVAWPEFQKRNFSAIFPLKEFSLLKHDGKQWNVLRTFIL
ncbi:MAG TPA: 2'-5' RNA ligase family protein [Bacteroidia bacterium]